MHLHNNCKLLDSTKHHILQSEHAECWSLGHTRVAHIQVLQKQECWTYMCWTYMCWTHKCWTHRVLNTHKCCTHIVLYTQVLHKQKCCTHRVLNTQVLDTQSVEHTECWSLGAGYYFVISCHLLPSPNFLPRHPPLCSANLHSFPSEPSQGPSLILFVNSGTAILTTHCSALFQQANMF